MGESSKITGVAYGRPATIEVNGDTVTWRARPDDVAENIVTTVHDVRFASWRVQRTSWVGAGFAGLAGVWLAGDAFVVGMISASIAVALIVVRFAQPRRRLVLEVGANQLVLDVEASSAGAAGALASRIEHAIASGELPNTPPTLP